MAAALVSAAAAQAEIDTALEAQAAADMAPIPPLP